MNQLLELRAQIKAEIKLWLKLKKFHEEVYGEVDEIITDKLVYLEELYLSI